ncbi:major facilitator superfamily transporter [Mollisia scopiformis]|uniref:Major facilitator superfamily transporter n=1 Tax=Mollisia scopiformis TaxID=149040 RepID=A0A194XIE1_MOLSC|nr:major facilitator superfamily transporter [Mollisia scopiformis]KUJ19995.1 major facilitator superfamily transporter [Mollisia scopiformis]
MSSTEKSPEGLSHDNTSTEEALEQDKHESAVEEPIEDESQYITGFRLALMLVALCMAVLLVGLDNAILATAIPTITTKFNSLDDVGWYGSAFLICVCALQPLSGKLFQYFSLKWTYLAFVFVFELGSLLCATAVSSKMLIVGRAVAGMGAAGLFSGGLIILGHSITPRERPLYTGLIASMFGISSIFGPILGGVFTQRLSWRWCFYINLPLGAVTLFVILLVFRPAERPETKLPFREKMSHLDLPGLMLFIPAVVMLLLAVQWGGNKYAWKSSTIIGLFVGFGLTIILFAAWQWRQQDEASIPPRIIGQRSILSAMAIVFLGMGSVQLISYYLPMYFQVIKGASPVHSGIRFLPTVLANFTSSILTGGLVTKFGHFNPWLFFGTGLTAIGSGIFSTFKVDTGNSMINGIQVLAGFGASCVIQMPLIGLMTLLPAHDLTTATSIVVFFQFLGGAIFLAIAENIFVSRLVSSLHEYTPSLDAQAVVNVGAEGLRKLLSDDGQLGQLAGALLAYDEAITRTFLLGAAGASVAFVASAGMEWKSFKK